MRDEDRRTGGRAFAFTVDYIGFAEKFLSGVRGRSNMVRGDLVAGPKAVGFKAK